MATGGSEVMSDEILNIKCSICVKKGLSREAEKYCIECQDYYCSSCIDLHTLFPSMNGHKLLDKASFRTLGPDSSLPSIPTQRCSLHPFKVTDMFCKDHDEIICTSCVALSHRSCTHIHSIPDDVDNLYNRQELTNTKQKINQVKISMQEIKKSKEHKLQELKKVFQSEVESVKAFQRELQELLDNLEQVTIKELKKEYDNIEKCIEADIKEVKAILKDIDDIVPEMKKCEGNKAQEFVCMKSSHKLTAEGEKLQAHQQTKQDTTVSFIADQRITTFLKEISRFGSVSTTTNRRFQPKTSLYSINSQSEINVQHSSDKRTDWYQIYGSCITEDGYLLLADYNNMRLKRLDMTKKTEIDFIDFKDNIYGVCLVSETEAAASLLNNSIQFVSLGKTMTTTSTLTMTHTCFGLAYNNGKLFVSDGQKTLYIYNRNGQELCKIEKDLSGKDIFQTSRHIAVSGDGKKVFVADNGKGLVILDIHGKHLSTLTDPIVSTIQGVCTDGKNVFVCGWNSQNIVQFDEDLKMLGQIEKLSASKPLSICFDKTKSRLFVIYHNSKVTVIELK